MFCVKKNIKNLKKAKKSYTPLGRPRIIYSAKFILVIYNVQYDF